MKILIQLLKTGLGLKLIFGDFTFEDIFGSSTEYKPKMNTFYFEGGWDAKNMEDISTLKEYRLILKKYNTYNKNTYL